MYQRYGYCRGGCGKWVPRDAMLSMNVLVYTVENVEIKIPLRFCPACHEQFQEKMDYYKWDNVLKTEEEIMSNKDLAAKTNLTYEPPKAKEKRFSRVRKTRRRIYRDFKEDDDSEAAMRKSGKHVDVRY